MFINYMDLAGGAFAMARARNYADVIEWQHHSNYFGFEILRAWRKDTQRPAALYGFLLTPVAGVLVVSENLNGIKKEAKKYAEAKE